MIFFENLPFICFSLAELLKIMYNESMINMHRWFYEIHLFTILISYVMLTCSYYRIKREFPQEEGLR